MKWRTPEPRPYYAKYKRLPVENDCGGWFACYELPGDIVAICEPQHLQEVNVYLIKGSERALLLDTGMGICNIEPLVRELWPGELTVVNCHRHFDHTGNNWRFREVLIADEAFSSSQFKSTLQGKHSGYIKEYETHTSVPFDLTGKNPTGFRLYCGPNHYHTLKAYDEGVEKEDRLYLNKLVPLGWKIVSWINTALVIPMFDLFTSWGLHIDDCDQVDHSAVCVCELQIEREDACAEAADRCYQREISGREDAGASAGDDAAVPASRRESDERLSADVIPIPGLDGYVLVPADSYRVAWQVLALGGRPIDL